MDLDRDKILSIASWVLVSSYRNRVMVALGDKIKTPSTLVRNTGIRSNHISKVLKQLKKQGLIICINEDAKKGRLYQLTELGKKVMQETKMI